MCILFVRRIRNISNGRDEGGGEGGEGEGRSSCGRRGSCGILEYGAAWQDYEASLYRIACYGVR